MMNRKAIALFGNKTKGRSVKDLLLFRKDPSLWKEYQKKGRIQDSNINVEQRDGVYTDVTVKSLSLLPKRFLVLLKDRISPYTHHQFGKDFVANASHELRTPITIIKGFAETIHDLPKISEAMLQDCTEKIIRNCMRMDNLVKNLLTLADLDHLSKLRLQECDLVALVDNCSHTLVSLHPTAQIESLQNQEVISISADPDLLELAIMNVLENSIKYSTEDPSITVTLELSPPSVYLTIADKGIGIPEEDVPHIFNRFYTVDKTHSRKLGGAGLGLSIFNTIMKKHRADVTVESQVGEGTQFYITFPTHLPESSE